MPFGPTEISSGYCGQISACPAAAGSGIKTQDLSRNRCFCRIRASAIANRAKPRSSSLGLDRSKFTLTKK
jgi:hypothetical protein